MGPLGVAPSEPGFAPEVAGAAVVALHNLAVHRLLPLPADAVVNVVTAAGLTAFARRVAAAMTILASAPPTPPPACASGSPLRRSPPAGSCSARPCRRRGRSSTTGPPSVPAQRVSYPAVSQRTGSNPSIVIVG
jgi:hypothetical protein